MDELRECPFCGEVPVVSEDYTGKVYIRCENERGCAVESSTMLTDDKQEAVREWNTRAADARIAALEAENAATTYELQCANEMLEDMAYHTHGLDAELNETNELLDITIADLTAEREKVARLVEALESVSSCIAFSPRDWSLSPRDAWIYGVCLGWSDDGVEGVAAKHRWAAEDVVKLKKHRASIAAIDAARGPK